MNETPKECAGPDTFVITPSLQDIISRTGALQMRGGVGVWFGEPGLGKTTAALHLSDAIDNRHPPKPSRQGKALYYQVGYGLGRGSIEFKRALKGLYEGAFHTPLDHSIYTRSSPEGLTTYILEVLREKNIRSVYIDDADYLSALRIRAILYLHSVAQRLGQPIGIIFIGTTELCNTLGRVRAALRRVEDWCFFKEYDLNDTWMLLAELHPHFGTLSPSDSEHRRQVEFLHEVIGGYPSRLATFILQLNLFPPPYNQAIDVTYLRTVHAYLQRESVAGLKFLKTRSKFHTKRTARHVTSTTS